MENVTLDIVGTSVSERLIHAFNALDEDMSNEALTRIPNSNGGEKNMKTLTVAMSGSVAVVAHIDGPMLHVASTGDCTAVLGSLSENDTWYDCLHSDPPPLRLMD
jgi:pyruvate dehydrogenase phosphatase